MSAECALLRELFEVAVAAADPALRVPAALPPPPAGRIIVVGAGKASAAMASAVEAAWPRKLEGLVVTRYGHAVPTRQIEVVEAGHPVPDEQGVRAAARMAALVRDLSERDLVLGLFSGGGSALLASPPPGVTLSELQSINRSLLGSGANIAEINCVRKHLSQLQGGRLGVLCHPAAVLALLISDVPGDDLATIASGPMVADPGTCADALQVIDRHAVAVPPHVRELLAGGAAESVKPGDPRLARIELRLIASPGMAIEAAALRARAHGLDVRILGDHLEGEARELGAVHGALARELAGQRAQRACPCVLLSGGETSVTVRGTGRGGRNTEYLLGALLALDGIEGVFGLAADTDGIDGTEDNAGATIGPDSLARARALGLDPRAHLKDNDAYGLFSALGDLVLTGPTRTNVNDFRALLIL